MMMLVGAVTTPGDAYEGSFAHNWCKRYKLRRGLMV
jgi:hypothetical protein